MMTAQNKTLREIPPIPDIPHVGLITYDVKDRDTGYPLIEPLRPPYGAPTVLVATRTPLRYIPLTMMSRTDPKKRAAARRAKP